MGNLASYKRAWGNHREAVRKIYRTWQDEMAKWEGYKGSKLGDEHIQAANDKYSADLAAARQRYSAEMDPVLQAMRKKLEDADSVVVPPTDEQLRVLQTVQLIPEARVVDGKMVGDMSMADYSRYLELCKGSNMAMKALWGLAKSRIPGGENLHEPNGGSESAERNYRAFVDSAKALGRWDGSSRESAVNAFLDEAHAGVPMVARKADMHAPSAGEIDPTSSDFAHDVAGIWYDQDAIALFD